MSRRKFLIITFFLYVLLYVILKCILLFNVDLYSMSHISKYRTIGYVKSGINRCSDCFNDKKKNIYIKNYFKDFDYVDESGGVEFYLKDDSSLYIGRGKSLLSDLNNYSEDSIFYELDHYPIYVSRTLREHIIKKYNIKNDMDLIKVARNNYKNSSFTDSVIKIKENYFFNYINNITYNSGDIVYINGKYKGYIKSDNNSYQITITFKNVNYYIILVNKKYFNKDMVYDIVSSIYIRG